MYIQLISTFVSTFNAIHYINLDSSSLYRLYFKLCLFSLFHRNTNLKIFRQGKRKTCAITCTCIVFSVFFTMLDQEQNFMRVKPYFLECNKYLTRFNVTYKLHIPIFFIYYKSNRMPKLCFFLFMLFRVF